LSYKVAKKLEKFLIQKDGVDLLYKNADEIEMNLEIPSKKGSSKTPIHYTHDWKFQDI